MTTQSGVKSMTLTLDGAREYLISSIFCRLTHPHTGERLFANGHAVVECVAAVWTYKYNNGYTVALRGPLTVHVVVTAVTPNPPRGDAGPSSPLGPGGGGLSNGVVAGAGAGAGGAPAGQAFLLKFDDFQFDASFHDKYIALESIMGPRSIESPRLMPPPMSMMQGNSQGGPSGGQRVSDACYLAILEFRAF